MRWEPVGRGENNTRRVVASKAPTRLFDIDLAAKWQRRSHVDFFEATLSTCRCRETRSRRDITWERGILLLCSTTGFSPCALHSQVSVE